MNEENASGSNVGSRQQSFLVGTLPVIPVADRFYGTMYHDGQRPQVTALVWWQPPHEDYFGLVLLSMVGPATSGAAVMAQVADNRMILFEATSMREWAGRPRYFIRLKTGVRYLEATRSLPDYTDQHFLMFPDVIHLEELLTHPPTFEQKESNWRVREIEDGDREPASGGERGHEVESNERKEEQKQENPMVMQTRFLLGNYHEAGPNRTAFYGHLKALRLPILLSWCDALWTMALDEQVITPLDAIGVKAWAISGNLEAWMNLISTGVAQGTFQWNEAQIGPAQSIH